MEGLFEIIQSIPLFLKMGDTLKRYPDGQQQAETSTITVQPQPCSFPCYVLNIFENL